MLGRFDEARAILAETRNEENLVMAERTRERLATLVSTP
jgi:hypothetical protein